MSALRRRNHCTINNTPDILILKSDHDISGITTKHQGSSPVNLVGAEMTCRDRTNEFISAVKSMQSRQGNGLLSRPRNQMEARSEFMLVARKIGRDLAKTFEKLEKLTICKYKVTICTTSCTIHLHCFLGYTAVTAQ